MGNATEAVSMRRDFIAGQLASAGLRPGALTALPSTQTDFDADAFYDQVLGTNCECVVGYMPVPVGVVGPLTVNGTPYHVPLATTEGALIASANRGARALAQSLEGGVRAAVYRDGMTRSPVVKFPSAMEAVEFAKWALSSEALGSMQTSFASTTRFGKLVSVEPVVAGKQVFLRFKASTGDAMGMNMVGKGVNVVLEDMAERYPEMKVVSLSGNLCTDKKPSSINWTQGRGKSVVAEATLPRHVVETTLKTTVQALASLNVSKNLIGSALAGSIGGNNAHASNMIAALYIATGQDPAQTVVSANCMTLLEASECGEFLHVSVTMPSLEVGTVGGGTTLKAQSACLEMLGVRGAAKDNPGENARNLANIAASTVLAGELSLNAALASGHLISAHMALNRKPDTAPPASGTQEAAPAPRASLGPHVGVKKQTISHHTEPMAASGGRRSSGVTKFGQMYGSSLNHRTIPAAGRDMLAAQRTLDMALDDDQPRCPVP